MTMEEEGQQHKLQKVPDAVIGRAIKDKEFRKKVLDDRNDMAKLNALMVKEKLPELDDAAYAIIRDLTPAEVNEVLIRIDEEGLHPLAG